MPPQPLSPLAPQPRSSSAPQLLSSSAISLLCCLLCSSAASAQTTTVAVIGAGISGLSAARTLVDFWPANKPDGNPNPELKVFVLEARDRIGGRIWTKTASQVGVTGLSAAEEEKRAQFDVGAGWIHYSNSLNPLQELTTKLDITGVATDHSLLKVWQCDSSSGCSSLSSFEYTSYEAIIADAQAAGESDTTKSMWSGAEGVTKNGFTRESSIMQFHMARDAERRLGAPMTDLSGALYGTVDDYGPASSSEILPVNGYSQIVEAIADGSVSFDEGAPSLTATKVTSDKKPLNVTLSKPVTKIKHASSGIEITTSDGTVWKADWALVTVPLGILKAGDITFDPVLSGDLPSAIDQMGYGNLVKVILHFDSAWWTSTDNSHFFGLAQNSSRGLFTYFLNGKQSMDLNVLITFASGTDADVADGMSDADVWNTVRGNLVKMFGSSQVPSNAKNLERHSWKNDQYSKGAYSYAKVGTESGDWGRFQQLIGNKMFFAGEHTGREYRGTVHGALESGQRVARNIFEEEGVFKSVPNAPSNSGTRLKGMGTWALLNFAASVCGLLAAWPAMV